MKNQVRRNGKIAILLIFLFLGAKISTLNLLDDLTTLHSNPNFSNQKNVKSQKENKKNRFSKSKTQNVNDFLSQESSNKENSSNKISNKKESVNFGETAWNKFMDVKIYVGKTSQLKLDYKKREVEEQNRVMSQNSRKIYRTGFNGFYGRNLQTQIIKKHKKNGTI